jgi:hypothetical protein
MSFRKKRLKTLLLENTFTLHLEDTFILYAEKLQQPEADVAFLT